MGWGKKKEIALSKNARGKLRAMLYALQEHKREIETYVGALADTQGIDQKKWALDMNRLVFIKQKEKV